MVALLLRKRGGAGQSKTGETSDKQGVIRGNRFRYEKISAFHYLKVMSRKGKMKLLGLNEF